MKALVDSWQHNEIGDEMHASEECRVKDAVLGKKSKGNRQPNNPVREKWEHCQESTDECETPRSFEIEQRQGQERHCELEHTDECRADENSGYTASNLLAQQFGVLLGERGQQRRPVG
eukprot:CAMPEP_0196779430 /NCGR_PEP_ID=MMETSP1104-20130614/6382_1 /TAXON_ID=33652 /ORGANISM="Cafeteria sp., Strain Caron Lab Isolate" /LENGTH=117 /DNA_ID=CAMNT_0042149609 /DNA_START=28 /DNA_END=378 /DNA_ORIENTATION=+